ncbi:hypothetical protein SeLEV6574_g02997 [Synchytrium endobioticum]|uniref:Uncharacterized protein n=1 Tax=Synchytrium endobioticum TaxID=286115 RepID=A0A507D664_9FUNG|nr:hypothetical protein SeLEV6574_g02997 [Synchytrium endobioticum]
MIPETISKAIIGTGAHDTTPHGKNTASHPLDDIKQTVCASTCPASASAMTSPSMQNHHHQPHLSPTVPLQEKTVDPAPSIPILPQPLSNIEKDAISIPMCPQPEPGSVTITPEPKVNAQHGCPTNRVVIANSSVKYEFSHTPPCVAEVIRRIAPEFGLVCGPMKVVEDNSTAHISVVASPSCRVPPDWKSLASKYISLISNKAYNSMCLQHGPLPYTNVQDVKELRYPKINMHLPNLGRPGRDEFNAALKDFADDVLTKKAAFAKIYIPSCPARLLTSITKIAHHEYQIEAKVNLDVLMLSATDNTRIPKEWKLLPPLFLGGPCPPPERPYEEQMMEILQEHLIINKEAENQKSEKNVKKVEDVRNKPAEAGTCVNFKRLEVNQEFTEEAREHVTVKKVLVEADGTMRRYVEAQVDATAEIAAKAKEDADAAVHTPLAKSETNVEVEPNAQDRKRMGQVIPQVTKKRKTEIIIIDD